MRIPIGRGMVPRHRAYEAWYQPSMSRTSRRGSLTGFFDSEFDSLAFTAARTPRRRTELRWKKCSIPPSSRMNPNPCQSERRAIVPAYPCPPINRPRENIRGLCTSCDAGRTRSGPKLLRGADDLPSPRQTAAPPHAELESGRVSVGTSDWEVKTTRGWVAPRPHHFRPILQTSAFRSRVQGPGSASSCSG